MKRDARMRLKDNSGLRDGARLLGGVALSLLFSVSNAFGQSLSLSWVDRSDNEDGFFVERSKDGQGYTLIGETGVDENQFVDDAIVAGEMYQYRVCSFNAFGRSDYLASEDVISREEDGDPAFLVKVDDDIDPVVSNGGFEDGVTPWRFYTNGSGSARASVTGYQNVGNAMLVRLDRAGSNMQLFQNDLKLEPDTEYELSFAAYSNSGRDMKVTLAKHTSPYTNYGLNRMNIDLTTEWKVFRIPFTTENLYSFVSDGRLYFWFADDARSGDRYIIDDVRLRKANAELPDFDFEGLDPDSETDGGLGQDGGTIDLDDSDSVDGGVDGSENTDNVSGNDGVTGEADTESGESVDPADDGLETLPEFGTGAGVIDNGGFESDMSSWRFYTNGRGQANLDAPGYQETDNAVLVRLDSSGTNIQLFQNDIKLLPNTPYRLTFAAYSNWGRDLSVSIGKHSTPYTNYGLSALPVDLGTDWKVYTINFTTQNFDTAVEDGRLFFWFAEKTYGGECFYIDSVSLTPLPDTDAPSTPANLDATRLSGSEVRLDWGDSVDNGGIVGYMVYRDGIDIGVSHTSEFTDADATGPHTYTVTAFDGDGNESAPSGGADVAR